MRQSNFELLRIIAMAMILIGHLGFGLTNDFCKDIDEQQTWIVRATLKALTLYAVNIYILISGYFGINKPVAHFVRLFLLIGLFGLLNYLTKSIFTGDWNSGLKAAFLPFSHQGGWFIQEYFYLILFSSFLNLIVENGKKYHLLSIIVLGFCLFYMDFIWAEFAKKGFSIWMFIWLYLLGRYINLYNFFDKISRFWLLMIFFFCIVFIYSAELVRYGHPIMDNHIVWYSSPFVVLGSLSLFLILKKTSISNNLYINKVAKSVLFAYLLQTCTFFSSQCYCLVGEYYLSHTIYEFAILSLLYAITYIILAFVAYSIMNICIDFINPKIINCVSKTKLYKYFDL